MPIRITGSDRVLVQFGSVWTWFNQIQTPKSESKFGNPSGQGLWERNFEVVPRNLRRRRAAFGSVHYFWNGKEGKVGKKKKEGKEFCEAKTSRDHRMCSPIKSNIDTQLPARAGPGHFATWGKTENNTLHNLLFHKSCTATAGSSSCCCPRRLGTGQGRPGALGEEKKEAEKDRCRRRRQPRSPRGSECQASQRLNLLPSPATRSLLPGAKASQLLCAGSLSVVRQLRWKHPSPDCYLHKDDLAMFEEQLIKLLDVAEMGMLTCLIEGSH